MVLKESNDTNGVISNLSYNLSKTTVQAGENSTVTIQCKLGGNKNVGSNTHYNFAISYVVDNIKSYFYYDLIILPIQ